jgi:hypothetical protein
VWHELFFAHFPPAQTVSSAPTISAQAHQPFVVTTLHFCLDTYIFS